MTEGKRTASAVCAIVLGLIFLISGGWKVLSPLRTGELLEQARVPAGWGAIGASSLGSLELVAAFLLFVPRFRKLGGILGSALIVFFIGWIGYYYHALVGQECSCFPIIKRTVGPGFFVGDGVMLLLGIVASLWSPAVRTLRVPAVALITVAALSGLSLGVAKLQNRGIEAPNPIVVDGKPQSIDDGKVFLFFYDPQCMHCDAAARFMAKLNWENTRVVAIPTTQPEFAAAFLHDTGLKAGTSLETERLRKVFKFVDPPYGVALVNGRETEAFGEAQFNVPSPKAQLEKIGFVQ
ncbi:MAG: MauE/DoxX family redox-associated membrane protein [Bryobacteraceae bacterium]